MPGFAVTANSTTVLCMHGGTAKPVAPSPRVKIMLDSAVTIASPYSVAACPFTNGTSPQPCVTATFTTASARVSSLGQFLLLTDSQATTVPNGVGVVITPGQTRVSAI
jgi:hypothetical protein